jgi:hypothetical protein
MNTMKKNEIGHHPYQAPRHQFDKGGFKTTLLEYENEKVKWIPNWKILGEVDVIDIPIGHPYLNDEPLIDLQAGSMHCYIADEMEYEGVKYIVLIGNGWGDEQGFPFNEVDFNPKEPFEHTTGMYALIRGVARDKFIELAKKDCIPDFNDIFTGDYKKDFVLTTN